MQNVETIERLIAKIDNDFNPDNSDWIPRVGAWCIDAMQQLNVLRTKRKRKKLLVKDRIAYSDCNINSQNIVVYDSNGCKIEEASNSKCCSDSSLYGEDASVASDTIIAEVTPNTVDRVDTGNYDEANYVIAETINDKYPYRYNVQHYNINGNNIKDKNYIVVDCNKIELNFDTDYIYIETEFIETYHSKQFDCEMPVIPNNGLLLEALAYYCMYKMLLRGYKHPVMNLAASQYGTNPYYQWLQLKDKAQASVIGDIIENGDASKLFRSGFYINSYDPRN